MIAAYPGLTPNAAASVAALIHPLFHCLRAPKMCNFLEWKERKLVYRRYASLFFVASIGKDDNELLALEIIHHYVEVLDKYFGDVCELDIMCVALRGSPARRVAACSVLCQQRATCSHPLLPSFRSGTTLKKRTLSSTR